jgi:hypothetical protein
VDVTRRDLLRATALTAVGAVAAGLPTPSFASPAKNRHRVTLHATVNGTGSYTYLPFTVPKGVNRIHVRLVKSDPTASVGVGIFDQRGAAYQSPGFRGVSGAERREFFLDYSAATLGFVPGPIEPGDWQVIVPVFNVASPTRIDVHVTMTLGAPGQRFQPGAECGVVTDTPGWYRGDLHCHTPHSSDAWSSHSAMMPAEWAAACRTAGLDYVSMTDHNVISQNYFLARDAGADVLLMAGEEMTNWAYGHATVSGISPGEWLDWRQSPSTTALPRHGARISEFIKVAESMGAYVAVAHPYEGDIRWQFMPETLAEARSRPAGFEVWTSVWVVDGEAALTTWDGMLQRGLHVAANGGSDLHGTNNPYGIAAGTPTTVVYADALSKPAIVAALKAGRSFITSKPGGADIYLTATAGSQATYTGGTIYGGGGDPVSVSMRVLRGGGLTLRLVAGNSGGSSVLTSVVLTSDDQTVTYDASMPSGGGYVRAEVRQTQSSGTGVMAALTNPIWLAEGEIPAGQGAQSAPVLR